MHGTITGKRTGQTATKAAPPDASKKTDSSTLPHATEGYALRSGMSTRSCLLVRFEYDAYLTSMVPRKADHRGRLCYCGQKIGLTFSSIFPLSLGHVPCYDGSHSKTKKVWAVFAFVALI